MRREVATPSGPAIVRSGRAVTCLGAVLMFLGGAAAASAQAPEPLMYAFKPRDAQDFCVVELQCEAKRRTLKVPCKGEPFDAKAYRGADGKVRLAELWAKVQPLCDLLPEAKCPAGAWTDSFGGKPFAWHFSRGGYDLFGEPAMGELMGQFSSPAGFIWGIVPLGQGAQQVSIPVRAEPVTVTDLGAQLKLDHVRTELTIAWPVTDADVQPIHQLIPGTTAMNAAALGQLFARAQAECPGAESPWPIALAPERGDPVVDVTTDGKKWTITRGGIAASGEPAAFFALVPELACRGAAAHDTLVAALEADVQLPGAGGSFITLRTPPAAVAVSSWPDWPWPSIASGVLSILCLGIVGGGGAYAWSKWRRPRLRFDNRMDTDGTGDVTTAAAPRSLESAVLRSPAKAAGSFGAPPRVEAAEGHVAGTTGGAALDAHGLGKASKALDGAVTTFRAAATRLDSLETVWRDIVSRAEKELRVAEAERAAAERLHGEAEAQRVAAEAQRAEADAERVDAKRERDAARIETDRLAVAVRRQRALAGIWLGAAGAPARTVVPFGLLDRNAPMEVDGVPAAAPTLQWLAWFQGVGRAVGAFADVEARMSDMAFLDIFHDAQQDLDLRLFPADPRADAHFVLPWLQAQVRELQKAPTDPEAMHALVMTQAGAAFSRTPGADALFRLLRARALVGGYLCTGPGSDWAAIDEALGRAEAALRGAWAFFGVFPAHIEVGRPFVSTDRTPLQEGRSALFREHPRVRTVAQAYAERMRDEVVGSGPVPSMISDVERWGWTAPGESVVSVVSVEVITG